MRANLEAYLSKPPNLLENEAFMRFWMVLLFALALATAGGFLHQHQLMVYDGVNITYVVFILSGLILLFLSALILNRSNGGNFDIVVASESIVAFGIAS